MSRTASRSVVLLSGGMDSATCLALAARRGPVIALTVAYGQRHRREIRSARALARKYRVLRHVLLEVPLAPIAPSALTSRRIRVPAGKDRRRRIPATSVPARHTVLLALGLPRAAREGRCDACRLRARGFREAGATDPLLDRR